MTRDPGYHNAQDQNLNQKHNYYYWMKAFFVYYKEMIEKNCNLNSHQGVSRIGIIKKAIELLKWQRSLIWELRQCTATRFKDFHAPYPSQLSSTTARPRFYFFFLRWQKNPTRYVLTCKWWVLFLIGYWICLSPVRP